MSTAEMSVSPRRPPRRRKGWLLVIAALIVGALAGASIVWAFSGGDSPSARPLPSPTQREAAPFNGDPRLRDPNFIVRFSFHDPEPIECPEGSEHGCWYWLVEPDHTCSSAEAEFGFAHTPRGNFETWDVLPVGELLGKARASIVYPITDPYIPEYADLVRILCVYPIER